MRARSSPPATLPLGGGPGAPPVTVLGYRPQYNQERRLWYVDVAIDPGSTFWPFVRLAVARYQPDSIPGCHLSAPVRCDFVQLTPERTTSVSRTDVRHVRVVVSGPIGVREPAAGARRVRSRRRPAGIEDYAAWVRMHRNVVARLQRRDPAIPTDLGWETVATAELTVRGFGRNIFEAAWVGELEAPRGPAAAHARRERRLARDGRGVGAAARRPRGSRRSHSPPVWEQRLVYADEILL